jgi:hypothetical protein
MKSNASGRLGGMALLLLLLCFLGCATGRIDWNSRIGGYSYDQAVLELGPPDKAAQLTDGTVVGEWLMYRGRAGYTQRVYSYRHVWDTYDPPLPDRFVRLTFGPDGMLQQWRNVAK